ncbi:hypothetical protein SIID45300_02047 [Candidatus Magnetaquicoccaceae bacterium FCR-1]|uniref:Uncharacterized protein n=1 Tax=Candidatus Magnetaquiglobus chichijimensis TaxID=3141448 RepID=A0ABQ0CA12_9PROT
MDEQEVESMDEEGTAKPGRKKILLLGGAVIALLLLLGGGWLFYTKLGAIKDSSEAEQAHREATEAEKKLRLSGPLKGVPAGIEGPEPPPVTLAKDGVSVDQLAIFILESGERRVQGRVYNHGSQPLIAARVQIEFLGNAGEVLTARPVNPLVISGGIFGDQSEILPSGSGRSFLVTTDELPANWNGKLSAKIMGAQFGRPVTEEARP